MRPYISVTYQSACQAVFCRNRKLFSPSCGLIHMRKFGRKLMACPRFLLVLTVVVCVPAILFAAASPKPQEAQLPPILPQAFGGWQIQGSAEKSKDPAVADPTNPATLKEYGFTDFSTATYTQEDGRTLKIRAARFADASGAFGAYLFYLQPDMNKEQIGDQGVSMGSRVLFYRGYILIDAKFSAQTATSALELRELAGALPRPGGSSGNLPSFIQFLPQRNYISNTQKYVMGPAGLAALDIPVTPDQVDFATSSELTLAQYQMPSGAATLILISYPTPQLAAEHLRRIDAAHQIPESKQEGVSTINGSGTFFDKRTGPIIAIASGGMSENDAKSLLGMVNWRATVTWNSPASNTEVRDLYMLILNIVVLCAILAGLAIIAGVAFGGFRILMKKLYPDRVFDRPEQMEFISLHLTETAVKGGPSAGGDQGSQRPRNPA